MRVGRGRRGGRPRARCPRSCEMRVHVRADRAMSHATDLCARTRMPPRTMLPCAMRCARERPARSSDPHPHPVLHEVDYRSAVSGVALGITPALRQPPVE
jgi:hypothetical protein